MQHIIRSFNIPRQILFLLGAFMLNLHCSSTNPVDVQNASSVPHESRIDNDETWSSKQSHIITDDVLVENATLTIEAGSVVKFQPGTSLKIQNGGLIIASGTASDSIRFTTAKADSAWNLIEINSQAEGSRFNHCVFKNGGSSDDSLAAMVLCRAGQVSITNSTFRNSQTNGLRIFPEAQLIAFNNNKFRENELAPVLLPASKVSSITSNNSFTGNGNDIIRIIEADVITENAKWRAQNVPYQFAVDFNVTEFALEFAPGVKLQFESFIKFTIGYKGGLLAQGTSDSTIEFRGVESQPGFWQGVLLKEGNLTEKNQFHHCVFSGGGSTPFMFEAGLPFSSNVFGEAGAPQFVNCRFENSSGYGVIFSTDCTPKQFEKNTISLNGGPAMRIAPAALDHLRENNIYNNVENVIEVTAGNITRESIIRNNQVPYRLTGELDVFYETVNIEPGTSFELNQQAGIAVSAGGALIADGISPSRVITFSGVVKQPGAWKFIYFGRDCNQSACKLNYCNIEYGGGDLRWPAIIYLEGASPQITNCQISYSQHWGIYKSNNAEPILTNTIFYSNHDGDVWP